MTVESAKLTIICEPEVNAKIILNHEDTGKTTPAEFTLVKGEYTIELALPSGYTIAEWWADDVPVSREPLLQLVLDHDTVVTAHLMIVQQQIATQVSYSMMYLLVAIVTILLIVSLIRELVGAFGSLRG